MLGFLIVIIISTQNNTPSSRIRTSDLRIPAPPTFYSPPLYQLSYRGAHNWLANSQHKFKLDWLYVVHWISLVALNCLNQKVKTRFMKWLNLTRYFLYHILVAIHFILICNISHFQIKFYFQLTASNSYILPYVLVDYGIVMLHFHTSKFWINRTKKMQWSDWENTRLFSGSVLFFKKYIKVNSTCLLQ